MTDDFAISFLTEGTRFVALVYDKSHNKLLDEITDYSIHLSGNEQLDHKTIRQAVYDLMRLVRLMRRTKLWVSECDSLFLEKFRDSEFQAVMSSVRSQRRKREARVTVNYRLVAVYRWFWWMQHSGLSTGELIGPVGCRVRSAAWTYTSQNFSDHRGRALRHSSKQMYPLLYSNVGGASKHTVKYTPNDRQRLAVIRHMHENAASSFVAHRNSLIVEIADAVGFRRASINSLRIAQFISLDFSHSDGGYISVRPPIQKFSYDDSFEFPCWLAARVQSFIRDYLMPRAIERKWKINLDALPLFVSDTSGRALADRTITQIVKKAMSASGAPRWNAIHAFRRKFAQDEIDREIEYRLRIGADTSAASISAAVSMRMGQKNPQSIFAYVSRALGKARREPLEELKAERAAL